MPKSVPSGTLENAAIIVFQHILIRPFQKACAYEIFHRLYEWESIACCPGWNRPCRWIVDKCICPCGIVLKPEFAYTIPAMEENVVSLTSTNSGVPSPSGSGIGEYCLSYALCEKKRSSPGSLHASGAK